MSLFSFIKKNKESYSLVFNIGSGSISGGIIRFTEKAGVDVSYYAKENIRFQKEVSATKHLQLMASALGSLANKIHTEGLRKISSFKNKKASLDRVFYIFSSPWSVSQTKIIKIKGTKVVKISEEYLNKVIDEHEKKFETEISRLGKIIERKIIQVKVNGYIVDNIKNKSGKDLEISVLFTVVDENLLHSLDEVVTKSFNIKNVWCHSLSLSVFSIIRNLYPNKEDFIHMDISEEVTDITIINDGVISCAATIPYGRNSFIRELSSALKIPESIADSMIKIQCAKHNNDLAALKMAVAMDSAARNWIAGITEVLDNFKDKFQLSDSIFLVSNSDLVSFLRDKLQMQDYKVLFINDKWIEISGCGEDLIYRLELMFLDNHYKI